MRGVLECTRADPEPDEETKAYDTIRELKERCKRAKRVYKREREVPESVRELTQSKTKKPERTKQNES